MLKRVKFLKPTCENTLNKFNDFSRDNSLAHVYGLVLRVLVDCYQSSIDDQ